MGDKVCVQNFFGNSLGNVHLGEKEGDGRVTLSRRLVCSSQVKWHEVCLHVPAAIKEVLLAWEHGAVTANDVKRILDAMRSRMCCLPVCATAWLCSYMQVVIS